MATRDGALDRAARGFDEGGFKALLARLVEIPSTSQEPGFEAELDRYLEQAIRPWVERLGFTAEIHPNPLAGFGPILTADAHRGPGPARPSCSTAMATPCAASTTNGAPACCPGR